MKKKLYQIVVMTLFLMSFNTICIGQELSINGYPVKEFSTIKDSKTWSYNYKQKFNKKSSTVWRQLGLNKRGWKQHSKYSHVSGYNGDISLKIITPGPITKLRVQAMLANYADKKVRKAKIAYSTNGIDFKTIVEKEFGVATLTGSTVLTNNQGILWLRFSRVLEKNDRNGKRSYVVFKSISFELTGNINSKKKK